MRLFTLLLLLSPAQFLFAQNNHLLVAETHYSSYTEAMFGRGSSNAPVNEVVASSATEKIENIATPTAVETTPLVEEKDTLSAIKPIAPAAASKSYSSTTNKVVEKKVAKKALGMWMRSPASENMNNCYALHKDAPIGSMIELKNPMNGRIVTVKVIGRLPGTGEYQNVTILVSGGAARQLHILDEKFLITMLMPAGTAYSSK